MPEKDVTFQNCEWEAIELLCRVGNRLQRYCLNQGWTMDGLKKMSRWLELVGVDVAGAVEMNALVGNGRGGYIDAKCRANAERVREICGGQWDHEEVVIEYRERSERMPASS